MKNFTFEGYVKYLTFCAIELSIKYLNCCAVHTKSCSAEEILF